MHTSLNFIELAYTFNCTFPETEIDTLAIKVKASTENLMMKTAHPWVFSDSIEKQNKEGHPGDIAVLFRKKNNKVFGVGLYDPFSPVRIKMLHYYEGAKIDKAFFTQKVKEAFEKRAELLKSKTTGYRLLFGENDHFSGLITDVYNQVAVVKIYSEIWFPHLKDVLEAILDVIKCETIVLRLSREIENMPHYEFKDGQVLYGQLESEDVRFKEYGITFIANVVHGHKTGFFLDHRANRKKVGELASRKTVLDVFSYNGGFSTHALVGGAKEVTSIDISQPALDAAVANARLNHFRGKHTTICGDAFEVLNKMVEQKRAFDLVVIDPPSFAKSKKEVTLAIKKYRELAWLGAKLTAPGGILVLASCSSRVSAKEFFDVVHDTLYYTHKPFKLLQKTFHDVDHPVTFEEGSYLKCIYYKRLG